MWMLLGLALGQTPDIEGARQRQEAVPALLAREAAAQARLADAEAFFAGELLLEEAWPRFTGAPLNDPAWLAGQLARLDARGAQRSAERLAGGPPDLAEALLEEQRADEAERELLLRLRGLLQVNPAASSTALAPYRAALEADRQLAVAAWTEDPGQALAVEAVDERIRLLDATLRQAILYAARGDELRVEACLDVDAARRLELLAPLAPEALQALSGWAQGNPSWGPEPEHPKDALARAEAAELWATTANPVLQPLLVAEAGRLRELASTLEAARVALIDTTVEEAELRQLEAQQALAAARNDQERHRAGVKKSVADSQQRAAQAIKLQSEREEALKQELGTQTQAVDDLEAETQAVIDAPKDLTGERSTRAATTYGSLRDQVTALRQLVEAAETDQQEAEADRVVLEAELATARLELQDARDEEDPEIEEDIAQWENALRALQLTSEARVEAEKKHRAAALSLLHRAKTERRRLRPAVPREVVAQDDVLGEAIYELSMLADSIWSLGRERADAALSLPDRLTDLGAIRGFLGGAFWVIVGLLAWRFARPRAGVLIRFALQRLAEQRPKAFRNDLMALEGPAVPAAVALIDALAVILLVGPALEVAPEVGLLLLIWLQVAVYRLMLGLYDLLVARGGARVALLVLPVDAWELGRRTVRWVLLWAIARQFLGRALIEILVADALHQLLMVAFNLILGVMALRLLHEWEPILRRRIAREGTDNAVRAYLASEPAQPRLTRWYRALADFVLLGTAWSWRFVQGQAREGSSLARLLNVFYRYSLSSDTEDEKAFLRPLPPELEEAIVSPATRDDFVRRGAMDDHFWGAIKRWDADHRHGTIAIVADRGAGRSTWLDRTCGELASEGRVVRRFALTRRCLDESSLCAGLSRGLAMAEEHRNIESLVAALKERPAGVIVVENAHQSFLRIVGGLGGIRALLEVLGQTSDRHCWVVTFHLPAWHYLSRLGGLLKVHIFQHRLELAPMNESTLKELLATRAERAGYTLDYSRLVRRGALSGDEASELERAITAFYRVLGEASYGNPRVAVELWRDCVHADPQNNTLHVRMATALSETRIEGLGEAELFTLAAVRMQDGLTEHEIASVNNMRAGEVRASLQILRARGLVDADEEIYRVCSRFQATVTRTLQHRNFLDWRG